MTPSGEAGTKAIDYVTQLAMRKYSRSGVLGVLAKGGIVLTALAVGVGVPVKALACISPPPTCSGACNCRYSSCYLEGCMAFACICSSCTAHCYGTTCFYAFQELGNGCQCVRACKPCNTC